MEPLLELAQLISKNKTKRIEIIGHPGNYNSRTQQLYEILTSQTTDLDESLTAKELFPDSKKPQQSYTRLKYRLFNRLINTLFFIDIDKPSFTDVQRAYYQCYKDFAAFKILIGRGGRNAAIKLGEKILKRAIEFEFTDLSVNVLRALRVQYSSLEGNSKKFKEANQNLKKQKARLEKEDLAEDFYTNLALHFINSRAAKPELAQLAKSYSDELRVLKSNAETQRFYFMSHYVHSIRYQIENDYEKTIGVCKSAISLLTSHPKITNKTFLAVFYNIKASASIKLRKYDDAQKAIETNLSFSFNGSVNWYISLYYLFLLSFHIEDYQKAFEVFKKAVANPQFNKLPNAHKEYWTIAEAHLHYLIANDEIELNLMEVAKYRKFRVKKFVNEVPVYSKDKRGANVSILVLQILFLLQEKKYEETISRIDNLKAYSNKYLRKNENFRSNCFIRMLQQLPKSYFNKKVATRKVKKYHDRLNEVPLEVAVQSSEMEIIPYEKLWKMVLKSLKG